MNRGVPTIFVAALLGCGGSPQAPTPPPPPPPAAAQPWSVSGRVTATFAGGPISNAHVEAFITSATSDGDGRFTLTAPAAPSGNQAITVTAAGYRPRETVIRVPRTSDLIVDLMPTAAPFSEAFFNELARDALDSPGVEYPLFRWPSALKFYLKTMDENGRPLSADVLALVRRGIRDGVHYYTAGTYEAVIEEGSETLPERVGYVNVIPRQVIPEGDFCGYASSVGANPMTIQLRIDRCGCGSIKIPIDIVIHEIGHAVGMFHVSDRNSIMNATEFFNCRDMIPSALERHHAALIYARPRGNLAPDRDPGGFALALPNGPMPGAPGRRKPAPAEK